MSDQPMQGPQWLQYWPGEYETQRQVEADQPATEGDARPPEDEARPESQGDTQELG